MEVFINSFGDFWLQKSELRQNGMT